MDIEQEIQEIKNRNARVEADKAWETSPVRVGLVALLTYATAVAFLAASGLPSPYQNALIPALGFVLSVQSIPAVKRWWIRRRDTKLH